MKAMVYHGANDIRMEEKPMPTILEATDAIVQVVKTTICGTDLGIWKGKNPEVADGRILGHEGVGIVKEIGSAVKNIKVGDKVIISCISRCGTCENCQRQLYAHCLNGGGWILGYMIDGTQAEYVRTPYADNSLLRLPEKVNDEVAVLLSDILPTGHEIGVQYGDVKPGDTVFIAGAGPVGMSALLTAQFYSPSVIIVADLDDQRLAAALHMGATHVLNPSKVNYEETVKTIVGERGVDCAIEAVGVPSTWDMCQHVVKAGGHIANVGVHGQKVDFNVEKLWIMNLTITTGLVNANTTNMLLKTLEAGKVDVSGLITHHFTMDKMEEAYDVFKHAAEHGTMKVIIENTNR